MPKNSKRKIAVVTGIRSEYSLLYPLMKRIAAHPKLELKLIVTGAHLSETFGRTVREIERDGFKIDERIESLFDSDQLASRVKGAAVQLLGLVQAFERLRPDILIAPFDREEALTVATAGSYLNIPTVHLGAGDRVVGNVDDHVRHAVTKLAHLHFCATDQSRQRVVRLGEEPWRVHNVGNLGLDKYRMVPRISVGALSKKLGFNLTRWPILVVLFHPLSSESAKAAAQMKVLMGVVDEFRFPTAVIRPNSDAGSRDVIRVIEGFEGKPYVKIFSNLEKDVFVNLLRRANVLIGNSSCGILEAPFLKLPVVNVGMRQLEREHAQNVIFVDVNENAIRRGITRALSDKKFLARLQKCHNPYGDGRAAERIVRVLASTPLNGRLLQKKITY